LSKVAVAIVENNAVDDREKVDCLYEAIDVVAALITRLVPPPPDKAPELWEDRRDRSEDPFAFTKRVYGCISIDVLRKMDKPLYKSRLYAAAKYGTGDGLRTKAETIDELVGLLGGESDLGKISAATLLKIRPILRLQSIVDLRRQGLRRTKSLKT
jgi:hypothetical protein